MDLRGGLQKHGDPVLALACAGVVTVETVPYGGGALGVIVALVSGLALAVRRRLPVASFLVAVGGIQVLLLLAPGMDGNSGGFIAIFFIAHYSLGRWSRGVEAWVAATCVLGSMLAFAIADAAQNGMGPEEFTAGNIGFAAIFVGGPWAAGLAIRLRQDRELELNAENDQLRHDQAEQAARAVAEERSRIARELHDVVAHAISVTVLQARGARRALDSNPTAVRRALDAIEQTNTAALGDMRRLLAVLRDTEPGGMTDSDDRGPQPSLAHLELLLEHVRASGVPVEVEVVGTPGELPPGVDLSAYRIVQEALTNVLKHSADARATVCVEYAEDALTVTVSDDGIPGPLTGEGAGHGLIGIRERVSVIGGEVAAGPDPAGGFTVRARLPHALELP